MDVTIRTATAADVEAMHHVRRRVGENRLSGTTGVGEASYAPYIREGSAWVAVAGDGIAGFAAIDGPAKTVWALFVDPEAEGAGIGRALHSRMLEWAREQGIGSLSLRTAQGSRAVGFYSRAGWRQTGITADGEVRFERMLAS